MFMYKAPSNKKLARKENKMIKKSDKADTKAYSKISKSTGLEFEPRVKKRDTKPLTKLQAKKIK